MKKKQHTQEDNKHRQDTDKMPGEERGQAEKVTPQDLKGKKVDADLSKESEKPVEPDQSHQQKK